jgi:hypothetical protein
MEEAEGPVPVLREVVGKLEALDCNQPLRQGVLVITVVGQRGHQTQEGEVAAQVRLGPLLQAAQEARVGMDFLLTGQVKSSWAKMDFSLEGLEGLAVITTYPEDEE